MFVGFRFDSLTGVPSAQRTVAFEKACVLFNLGALHTQIGARQERCTGDGLDASVDNFLRAASIFRFIVDNFTNAPSMDLAPQVLEALILLMIVRSSTFHPLFHLAFWPLDYHFFQRFSLLEKELWRKGIVHETRSAITTSLALWNLTLFPLVEPIFVDSFRKFNLTLRFNLSKIIEKERCGNWNEQCSVDSLKQGPNYFRN